MKDGVEYLFDLHRRDFSVTSYKIRGEKGYNEASELENELEVFIQNELVNEDDIHVGAKNVPTIWYNDESGKKHRHYVDIFIKSQNRCIEVKSTWTAQKKKDNIFLKQTAAKQLGYKYEIWVYDNKGVMVQKHE